MKEPRVKGWWLIRLALIIVGSKGLKELTKASKDGKKAQDGTLRHILDLSKDTVYGKEHHFDEILKADTADELFKRYQNYVPANNYEDLQPYIERHKQGEAGILFPGKPKLYATTSGTTKEPKWIPVTETYYREVYKGMNQLWFYLMMREKPHVWYGPSASLVGKSIEGAAPDGTVYGSLSGIMQRDIPKFMHVLHTAPAEVFHIADYKARYYAIMRMAIGRNVHCIITANPSTLVEMQTNANEFYDEYVKDVEQGTLSRLFTIPEEIRSAIEAKLTPNPGRAAELRALKAKYGKVLPKHYWPELQTICVWFCGNTQVYFNKIKDSFPTTTVFHEFSYMSTECKAGLVLKSNSPDTVVFGHKIYFEFIHESEMDNPNPRIYQIYEVEKGQRYCMLVTTSAGLYRYNMNDLLEITGYYNQFPTLKFIQKLNGTISLTGEKLHERQFIEAVREAEKKTGRKTAFFVGFADIDQSNYKFYYEFADQGISKNEAEQFTKEIDEILKTFNMEYKEKRASNRLKDPETRLLQPESFEQFKAYCIDQGYRDGQFKVNLLMQDEKRHGVFKELVKG
ncbi:GH3 auxin-responsive promoter superfamily [Treponema primitia ZAS-2]|uniref:GH3 auxin-responsive promoter superfamily n=2 Tax=Treponema primitia TaxID=88058 RepID=F5YH84_TREPZ|nr:GH3 auxin-responsive promoter superfamily [Treponema primitia ZAS-2]